MSKISLSWNVNHKLQISIPKGAFTVKAKWQELMDNDELKVNATYPDPKILGFIKNGMRLTWSTSVLLHKESWMDSVIYWNVQVIHLSSVILLINLNMLIIVCLYFTKTIFFITTFCHLNCIRLQNISGTPLLPIILNNQH